MSSDLSVIDNTALTAVNKFHRIFNRDDMIFAMLIGIVDDRCECGRLSTPCRTGDQNKPLIINANLVNNGRKPNM
jgi:hypothetical protein